MADLSKYDKPQEVSDVDLAFPAHVVGKLIPKREDLPEEFQKNWTNNEYCELASRWFYKGLRGITFKEGIDTQMAGRHIQAVLGSFEPSHEEKIGGAGYLMSIWECRELDPPKEPQKDGRKRKKGKKSGK